jgi:hypothetical protein
MVSNPQSAMSNPKSAGRRACRRRIVFIHKATARPHLGGQPISDFGLGRCFQIRNLQSAIGTVGAELMGRLWLRAQEGEIKYAQTSQVRGEGADVFGAGDLGGF